MPTDLPRPAAFAARPPAIRAPGAPPSSIATAPSGRRIAVLNGPQKAAILVRFLMAEGAEINLASLPEEMQTELTSQIAAMRLVDRETLMSVVGEFVEILEQVGLTFPEGIEGALKVLGGRLSPGAAGRLRRLARASGDGDPWERIAATETPLLNELLSPESTEVAAVVLSKLPVPRAAELLGAMPGPRARAVAFAVSLTEGIEPRIVARIGAALAAELDRRPPAAFPASSAARVGAILNTAPPGLRDDLLAGLDEEDAGFATVVRRSIFTFAHIHRRIRPLDMPKLLREVPQDEMVTALAAALPESESDLGRSAEFILGNISQRMAASLRDEVESRGKPRAAEAEAAMAEVVAGIRRLIDAAELTLEQPEDE